MKKRRLLGLGALLLGALVGHAVASGKLRALLRGDEEKPAGAPEQKPAPGSPEATTTD